MHRPTIRRGPATRLGLSSFDVACQGRAESPKLVSGSCFSGVYAEIRSRRFWGGVACVGAIDAFMTTWSNARETLGQGTPQEGAPFDNSAQLRQMQTAVQSVAPGDKWTGSAADSYGDANSKQARVLGQMAGLDQRLGIEVDRSAAAVTAGRQNLDGVKQWVLDAAAAVPAGDDREQQLLPIARKGIGDVADVVKQTNGDLNAIGARIQAIGNEYEALGDPTKKDGDPNNKDPRDNIVGDKDDPKKSKEQAQKDVEAALGGDKAASGRVANVLNTIDSDHLAGKKPLTPEQASYLSQMQAQQQGMSVYDLKKAADNGAKGIMADSWQLMSNPNVKFPPTDLTHGALDDPSKSVTGGFGQLPREVQNAIQSPGLSSSDDIQKISDIVHGGNPHFQTNTDLDRGLIHKAADMMNDPGWKATDYPPGSGPHFGEPSPEELHRSYDQAVSGALGAVSPDHQVVHDALTGHVDNPNNAKFGVDGTQFLHNLTTRRGTTKVPPPARCSTGRTKQRQGQRRRLPPKQLTLTATTLRPTTACNICPVKTPRSSRATIRSAK
jgi:hypothetical protein